MFNINKKKELKPQTGMKSDSAITGMLKKLSSAEAPEAMPQMPEPIFDEFLSKNLFKTKRRSS